MGIALLQGVMTRKRQVKDCLAKLPNALNFNVCKGPLARARKSSIEAFLEGQLAVLDACLENMRTAADEENAENKDGADEESDLELEDEEEEIVFRKKKKRRGR